MGALVNAWCSAVRMELKQWRQNGADAVQELADTGGLGEDGVDSYVGGERVRESFGVHGEGDDANLRQQAFQDGRSFHAVHAGHGDIQKDQIGLELAGFVDGVNAVGGFAADDESGAHGETSANGCANGGVVVNDENRGQGRSSEQHEGSGKLMKL